MTHTVRCDLCGWQQTVIGPDKMAAHLWLDHYRSTHQS